ncbi:MAG: HlyD family efflux transporter periplasmic adaptor subunit, partial [Proteobacteria bacterium]
EVDDCVLRAPFEGEVAHRLMDPGAFARPGSSIVTVVDRSIVRLSIDVPESDFDAVAPGTPARIHLLSTGKDSKGTVTRRSPGADPSTRTVHVEIDLPDTGRTVPVGTTAEVSIDVGEPVPATEIPILAAKVRGTTATVFYLEGDTAKKATYGVLGESGGSLFVQTELRPGTHVVTQGRSLLAPDDRVITKLEAFAGVLANASRAEGGKAQGGAHGTPEGARP